MASSTKYIRTLRRLIDQHFTIDEVRLLCSDLGFDFDNLFGSTKVIKIDSLLRQVALQGRIVELAQLVHEQFPNAISLEEIEALPLSEQQKEDYSELVMESESQKSIWETYIKNITALLNSVGSGDRKAIKAAAQTYTTATFPKFDKKYLELAIRFLGDSGCFGEDSIVSLAGMDFSGLDLSKANLRSAFLRRTKLINCNLQLANLRAANLIDVDLTNANLTGANLTDACVLDTKFTNANLSKADFTRVEDLSLINLAGSNANLSGIKLHNIEIHRDNTTTKEDLKQNLGSSHVRRNLDLSGLDFTGSQFTDVNLWELNLTGANLTRCFFGHDFHPLKVIFNEADLSYAEFHGCPRNNLYPSIWAKFENAKLHGTRFIKSNKASKKVSNSDMPEECGINISEIKGADLRDADLSGIGKEYRFDPRDVKINYSTKLKSSWRLSHQLIHQGLKDQNLRNVDLSYTTLIEMDFSGRDLSGSNFTGTWLFRSKFVNARLVNTTFVGADLDDIDFTDADLRNANLCRVNFNFCLTNVRLDGANLREASLSNADLSKVTITDAIYDQYTSWPDGFNPATAGARFIETKDE